MKYQYILFPDKRSFYSGIPDISAAQAQSAVRGGMHASGTEIARPEYRMAIDETERGLDWRTLEYLRLVTFNRNLFGQFP